MLDNPFATIGPAPPRSDPEAQLRYLESMLLAFKQSGHPRIKPVKKRVLKALATFTKQVESGRDPEVVGKALQKDIDAAKLQSFELVVSIVNEISAKLGIRAKGSIPPAEREAITQMREAMGDFSGALRKLVKAIKNKDTQAEEAAMELLNASAPKLKTAGRTSQELAEGSE